VLEAQEKELAHLERETQAWLSTDVATLNQQATRLGLEFVRLKGQAP
jgi:hypothetical protein